MIKFRYYGVEDDGVEDDDDNDDDDVCLLYVTVAL